MILSDRNLYHDSKSRRFQREVLTLVMYELICRSICRSIGRRAHNDLLMMTVDVFKIKVKHIFQLGTIEVEEHQIHIKP